MSDMKPKGNAIKLGNRDCRLLFTINVMDSFQDKFDVSISEIDTKLKDFKARFKVLPGFCWSEMINEYISYAGYEFPDSGRRCAFETPVTEMGGGRC